MKPIAAIVLAGGPKDEIAALTPGAPNKAFTKIEGVTLVERTLRGLREAQTVGRIIAVAPPSMHEDAALHLADECRPDGRRISDSVRSGLAGLPLECEVLVSASDLPILNGPAIDDFLEKALAKDAAIGYGCVERRAHEAKFPRVPHTWARLRDATYCGSGFITLKPAVYPALEHFIERLGGARKNPLRLASLFGWNVLLRFIFKRLSIAQAEARASAVIGAPVRAVVSSYPEIAVNVDRLSDVGLARELIRANASA